MSIKIKKLFEITPEEDELFQQIKQANDLQTDIGTFRLLLNAYRRQTGLHDEVKAALNEWQTENKKWMDRVYWASQTAERKSTMILDAVNTIFCSGHIGRVTRCALADNGMHEVLEQSEERIKEKIEHFKQMSDFRKQKSGKEKEA